MRKHFLTMSVAALLIAAAGITMIPTKAAADTASDFDCNYSASTKGADSVTLWGATEIVTYSAAEAAATGVPTGYDNQVLEVKQTTASRGILLDYSAKKVPMSLVEGLNARVYLGTSSANMGKYPQLRIPDPTKIGEDWIHLSETATPTGEWTTVSIPATKFDKLAKDGYLQQFELGVRSNAMIDFFIDSIALDLKENDGVAPVISLNEAETITWFAGVPFTLDATAFDAQENRNVEVQTSFGADTQFAEDGTLKEGTWSVTLSATDYFGNQSTKECTVVVLEPDKTPPVITTVPQTMYATVGTIPMLKPSATDDSGDVTVTASWSQGALDEKGRLTAGTHTYTIEAKDASGNVATHTVTVIVSANGAGDSLIDEEEDYQEYLAQALVAARDRALSALATELNCFNKSDYSEENYALITAAHEAAKDAIYAETDSGKLDGIVQQFRLAADAVKTIEEENPPKPIDPPVDEPDEPDEPDNPDTPVNPPVDNPTENPDDQTPSGGETNEPVKIESGCGSTVAAATVVTLLGAAMVALKKKKE